MNFIDAIVKATVLLLQAATVSANSDSTAINVEATGGGFDGPVLATLVATAGGAAASVVAKLTHSDTEGGTYTDVLNGSFGSVGGDAINTVSIVVDGRALKKWVRVNYVETGTYSSAHAVTLTGIRKYT